MCVLSMLFVCKMQVRLFFFLLDSYQTLIHFMLHLQQANLVLYFSSTGRSAQNRYLNIVSATSTLVSGDLYTVKTYSNACI